MCPGFIGDSNKDVDEDGDDFSGDNVFRTIRYNIGDGCIVGIRFVC